MDKIAVKRFLAIFLDIKIILIFISIYAFLFGNKIFDNEDNSTAYRLDDVGKILTFILIFFYSPLMNLFFKGTLGKKIVGIEILFKNEKRYLVNFIILFLRNILTIIEFTLSIGILPMILLLVKGKRLADYITATEHKIKTR